MSRVEGRRKRDHAAFMVVLAGFTAACLVAPVCAFALPPNVDKAADTWLRDHLDQAMPWLLQTEFGPVDREHVHVVTDLGEWGAARSRGGHQGTDFVLDLPHKDSEGRVYVGSVVEGKVVHAEPDWGSYGNTVFVMTAGVPRLMFIFAHLDTLDVGVGDEVEVGDILGMFGCTGNCRGLSGHHVRYQVHVEVYALPDDFEASDITWSSLPMRQLRTRAHHTRRKPHGVDVTRYFETFEIARVSRADLAESYAENKKRGGLGTYLEAQSKEVDASLADDVLARLEALEHTHQLAWQVYPCVRRALSAGHVVGVAQTPEPDAAQ